MLRQKRYHDTRARYQKLKPNDVVWVYFPTVRAGTSPKLTTFWRGPYTITRVISDVTYEVQPVAGGRKQVVHSDRIKPRKVRHGSFNAGGSSIEEVHQEGSIEEVHEEDYSEQTGVDSDNLWAHGDHHRPTRTRMLPRRFDDFEMY